jgi:prefoldin subunit 5
MAVSDARRLQVFEQARAHWGEGPAETLMELVVPAGPDMATKADIDMAVVTLSSRIDGTDRRIDGLDTRIDRLSDRIDGLDQRIDGLDTRIDRLSDRFDGLDQRIDGLDTRIDRLSDRIDGFDRRIDGLDSRIDGIDSRMQGLATKEYVLRTLLIALTPLYLGMLATAIGITGLYFSG